jgi:hypothetical protein
MPGGDRTGPVGAGAMTGRGLGYCSGSRVPGFLNSGSGRGFGGGRGRGRGWRHRHYATGAPGRQRARRAAAAADGGRDGGVSNAPASESLNESRDDEITLLRRQAEELKDTLGEIASRIEQLEAKPPAQNK